MKYGLLTNSATTNIGDDIQSYAALRFLPSVDYVLDREKLDGFVPDDEHDEVMLVDLDEELVRALKERYHTANWVQTTHNAEPETFHRLSMQERMDAVERRLKRYQGASCVITERLHCALPCLALGTPVLLIYRSERLDRMGSFLPLLHAATPEELLAGQVDFDVRNPPENPTTYLRYRHDLERRCKEFVAACERGECPPPIAFSKMRLACWRAWYQYRPRVVVRTWLHRTGLEGPLRSFKRSVLEHVCSSLVKLGVQVSGHHG